MYKYLSLQLYNIRYIHALRIDRENSRVQVVLHQYATTWFHTWMILLRPGLFLGYPQFSHGKFALTSSIGSLTARLSGRQNIRVGA